MEILIGETMRIITMILLIMFTTGCAFSVSVRLSNPFEDRPVGESEQNEVKVTAKLG